jgi:hypothetical protein
MNMAEIKKIHIWSFVKIIVILGLILGLIWGIGTSVYTNIAANKIAAITGTDAQAVQTQMGMTPAELAEGYKSAAKIVWIIITAISLASSFILALIIALVYNLTSKYIGGGIKIDLEK